MKTEIEPPTEDSIQNQDGVDSLIHRPVRKTLFQRLLERRWATLVISLLINAIIILIASLLVVHVVQGRKKLSFTAPPPSEAAKEVEHQVQLSKKSKSEGAPNVTKLITSTAANVKIALPPVDISSESPDVMSSVMSGIGGMGLGAGAGFGGAGGGGGPSGGMTAFGFKNASAGTMAGTFYDLSQSSEGRPKSMDATLYANEMDRFVRSGMNNFTLDDYFKSPDKIYASQYYIPKIDAADGPSAFNMKSTAYWAIHYEGVIIPKVSGTYRFWGVGDDILTIQMDHHLILNCGWYNPLNDGLSKEFRNFDGLAPYAWMHGLGAGEYFKVEAGHSYPIDILIGHQGTGFTMAILLIEKEGESYQHDSQGNPVFPIFKLAPIPFTKPAQEGPVFAPDTHFSVWNAERPK